MVDLLGHLLDGGSELECDAVEKRSGSRRADPAHFGGPHSHPFVEDHRLAVLSADVEDRLDMRIVVQCSRHMRGDFADLEIIMDEPLHPFDDLTARHDRAADVFRLDSRVREKGKNGLFARAEIAASAFRTFAGAGHAAAFHRFGPLIGHMFDFPVLRQNDGFKCGGTNVDSQITFLLCHDFRSCPEK